jgi:ankyrin repeat protein
VSVVPDSLLYIVLVMLQRGRTSLHDAAATGRVADVTNLLERDAGMCNLKSRFGRTALHDAAENGHAEVVKVLIDHGAIDAKAASGRTALDCAVSNGHTEVVRVLLKLNSSKDSNVLLAAASRRSEELSSVLSRVNRRYTPVPAGPVIDAFKGDDFGGSVDLLALSSALKGNGSTNERDEVSCFAIDGPVSIVACSTSGSAVWRRGSGRPCIWQRLGGS